MTKRQKRSVLSLHTGNSLLHFWKAAQNTEKYIKGKSVKSALCIQLVEHRGVKGKKKRRRQFQREAMEGEGAWMSRKGYWRQIPSEAGNRTQRQTNRKRSRAQRRERGGGRAAVSVSPLLPTGCVAARILPEKFPPERIHQCAVRSSNDGLLS